MSTAPRTRRLEFEALFNFRDLGGYTTADGSHTRWGSVFRADGLHRATPGDLRRLEAIGITTVVDLRTGHERVDDGSFDAEHPSIDYRHSPIFDDLTGDDRPNRESENYLAELYVRMIAAKGDRLVGAVRAIVDAPGPVVFHCTAGKDRTGVVAALMLSAVGVADDTIAQDYALSHAAMDALVDWYRTNRSASANNPMAGVGDPSMTMTTS